MNEVTGAANLVAAKKKLSSKFFKKGITVAILSGMFYGLYSTFLMLSCGHNRARGQQRGTLRTRPVADQPRAITC